MIMSENTGKVKRRKDLCTKCGAEPRRNGQRWGAICHASNMRDQRLKQKRQIERERAEMRRIRQAVMQWPV